MAIPIFDTVKATHDFYRATARAELLAEVQAIKKPSKQILDLIAKYKNA